MGEAAAELAKVANQGLIEQYAISARTSDIGNMRQILELKLIHILLPNRVIQKEYSYLFLCESIHLHISNPTTY